MSVKKVYRFRPYIDELHGALERRRGLFRNKLNRMKTKDPSKLLLWEESMYKFIIRTLMDYASFEDERYLCITFLKHRIEISNSKHEVEFITFPLWNKFTEFIETNEGTLEDYKIALNKVIKMFRKKHSKWMMCTHEEKCYGVEKNRVQISYFDTKWEFFWSPKDNSPL